MESLFNVLLPILSAGLTTLLMTGLKKAVTFVGTLPAIAQQVIVGAGSWGVTQLALLATVQLSTGDVTALASSDLLALSSAGLAFVFHLASKKTA